MNHTYPSPYPSHNKFNSFMTGALLALAFVACGHAVQVANAAANMNQPSKAAQAPAYDGTNCTDDCDTNYDSELDADAGGLKPGCEEVNECEEAGVDLNAGCKTIVVCRPIAKAVK